MKGDAGICRCLTSIAKSIAFASQSAVRLGKVKGCEVGMIELLLKAASHSSIHVCGIALESLQVFILPDSALAM